MQACRVVMLLFAVVVAVAGTQRCTTSQDCAAGQSCCGHECVDASYRCIECDQGGFKGCPESKDRCCSDPQGFKACYDSKTQFCCKNKQTCGVAFVSVCTEGEHYCSGFTGCTKRGYVACDCAKKNATTTSCCGAQSFKKACPFGETCFNQGNCYTPQKRKLCTQGKTCPGGWTCCGGLCSKASNATTCTSCGVGVRDKMCPVGHVCCAGASGSNLACYDPAKQTCCLGPQTNDMHVCSKDSERCVTYVTPQGAIGAMCNATSATA